MPRLSGALVVDFAPHAIRYAGSFGDRWFVSLVHDPLLLALDASGNVVERAACPHIQTVVGGKVALGSTRSQVPIANVQRSASVDPEGVVAYDVATGKELWRHERHHGPWSLAVDGYALFSRQGGGFDFIDVATGTTVWSTDDALALRAHDADRLYLQGDDGTVHAKDRRTGRALWSLKPRAHRPFGPLYAWADCVWHVVQASNDTAVIRALSASDGQPVAQYPCAGEVDGLCPAGDSLLVLQESGISAIQNGELRLRVDHLDGRFVKAHAGGFVFWNGGVLGWTSDLRQAPRQIAIGENDRGGPRRRYDWQAPHLEAHAFALVAPSRVLRVPLATEAVTPFVARVTVPDVGPIPLEKGTVFFASPSRVLVEHATRGRFWFDEPNSGLSKGDPVEIGGFCATTTGKEATVATTLAHHDRVVHWDPPIAAAVPGDVVIGHRAEATSASPRPSTLPKAVASVVDVLVEHGFIDPLSPAQIDGLVGQYSDPEREAGATTAAEILRYVYADEPGADRGVVHHDVRFGNETDDVVAELAATLADEPIAFAQTDARDEALQIRAGAKTSWVSFVPGGLDAIVQFMNLRLAEAGARRRIFTLATESDWSCYVVRPPEDVEAMKRQGLRGFAELDRAELAEKRRLRPPSQREGGRGGSAEG